MRPAGPFGGWLRAIYPRPTQFKRRHLSLMSRSKRSFTDSDRGLHRSPPAPRRPGRTSDQVVPVAAVPRQARSFDAKHGADFTGANFRDQALKSSALHKAGPRAYEVFVDHHDVPKTEFVCLVGQTILPSLTLLVVKHLFGGKLPKVDDRPPFQPLIREFGFIRASCGRAGSGGVDRRLDQSEGEFALFIRRKLARLRSSNARLSCERTDFGCDFSFSSCDSGDVAEAISQGLDFCKLLRR